MNKDYKPVYVQGTETGKGVIEALEAIGGVNNCGYKGCRPCIYYIYPKNNFICQADEDSPLGLYIKATAEKIKPIKWRAKQDGMYYLVDTTMDVIEVRDYGTSLDDNHYNCGNYFKTREEAEKMAEKIKKILLPD